MTNPATLAAQLRQIREDLSEARRFLDDVSGTLARLIPILQAMSDVSRQLKDARLGMNALTVDRLTENVQEGLLKQVVLPTLLPAYIDGAIGELGWLASSLERAAENEQSTAEREAS